MSRKKAEEGARSLFKRYGYFWHKYGDVRYCIHCQKPLPKSEKAPDYATAAIATWVECKNSNNTDRWPWKEIYIDGPRSEQRNFLIENGGWLYILLGPHDEIITHWSAFLVPFDEWVAIVEPILLEYNMSSIGQHASRGKPGADELLAKYKLEYVRGTGFTIPKGHIWWHRMYERATLLIKYLEKTL